MIAREPHQTFARVRGCRGSGSGRCLKTSRTKSRGGMVPSLTPSGAEAGHPGPRVDARKAWATWNVTAPHIGACARGGKVG